MADVVDYCNACGTEMSVSDGGNSLVEEMMESQCILVRRWSGAVVQALYYKVPLVVWMPRNTLPATEYDVLTQLPMVARDADELAAFLVRMRQPEYLKEIQELQDLFLCDYIKESRGAFSAQVRRVVAGIEKLDGAKSNGF